MQRRLMMLGLALAGVAAILLCTGCDVTTLQLQDYAISSAINIAAQAIVTLVASGAVSG